MASQELKSSNRKPGKTSSTAILKTAPAAPTKVERLIELLRRKNGASLEELCKITGWQAHSVRGAIAGSLKKKGHVITSEKIDSIRRYRIGDPQ